MRHLSWIVTIPLTIVIVVFAIANRHATAIDLWPFPVELSLPTFLIVLISFLIGLLIGGLVSWISAGKARARARRERFRAEQAERDVARLKQDKERAARLNTTQAILAGPEKEPLKAAGGSA